MPQISPKIARKLLSLPHVTMEVALEARPAVKIAPMEVVTLDLKQHADMIGIPGIYESARAHKARGGETAFYQLMQVTLDNGLDGRLVAIRSSGLGQNDHLVELSVSELENIAAHEVYAPERNGHAPSWNGHSKRIAEEPEVTSGKDTPCLR